MRVSAFKENCKHAFPIDDSCESFFNVPKMDDSVEALLIKRFGHKAGFSRVPSLVSKGKVKFSRSDGCSYGLLPAILNKLLVFYWTIYNKMNKI